MRAATAIARAATVDKVSAFAAIRDIRGGAVDRATRAGDRGTGVRAVLGMREVPEDVRGIVRRIAEIDPVRRGSGADAAAIVARHRIEPRRTNGRATDPSPPTARLGAPFAALEPDHPAGRVHDQTATGRLLSNPPRGSVAGRPDPARICFGATRN
jgi:hypothetical protein